MDKVMNFFINCKRNKGLILLALPSILFVFVFNYIPLYGLILAFKDFRYDMGFFNSPWSGLKNFQFLINSDVAFIATRNTILFNVAFIVINLVFSVIFALILFELSRRAVKVYQTILIFPYFVSWIVASYIFYGLLDMEHGFINTLLAGFWVEKIAWYNEPKYWIFILIFANAWKSVGYYTIIYYTGLMGIDSELFEAASLDGAGKLQQIRMISIPLLQPLITMIVILSIGRIFYADFGLFYSVTRDSAALYPVTDVIDTYVYRALKQLGDVGMASAAGFYQSIIGFTLVFVTNMVVRKISPENSLF